ncbi:MAG: tetratricopeptide repeat protein [bacterium]
MWHKSLKYLTLLTLCLFLLGTVTLVGHTQLPASNYPTLDQNTERAVSQLERLIYSGTPVEIQMQIDAIIRSAGYVYPLAKVFYNLAQTEEDASRVIDRYKTILQEWADSAWAQKAVPELVTLILMSQGELGQDVEPLLWQKQDVLLTPAADAISIGEEANLLVTDVRIHLIYLANYRNYTHQLQQLVSGNPNVTYNQDIIELARAFSTLREERLTDAARMLNDWLMKYSGSSLRPYAMLGLYYASTDQQSREEALVRIAERYPQTLEAMQIRQSLESSQ